MLEKASFPRYKTCGGGVISRVTDLLPYDLDLVFEKKINEADIFDHSTNQHFHIERENPFLNMTMREKFDMFLLKKAVEKDAISLRGLEATDIYQDEKHAEAASFGERYSAKFIIGADGATGITTKVLGIQKYFKKIPALEGEIFVDKSALQRFDNTARFDFGMFPKGYGWVFPKRDHLSIGVLSFNNTGINLNKYLKDYLDKLQINNATNVELHGYIIPFHRKIRRFGFGRILLIGDAAGLADPLTAEGISYAIESGRYAAEAILKGGDNVELVNKIFEMNIKQILPELKYAGLLSRFFYSSSSLRNYFFKKHGENLCSLMTDIICGKAKYSKALKNPANYLRLIKAHNLVKTGFDTVKN
jgi:geranylgeranyl reductase family protein